MLAVVTLGPACQQRVAAQCGRATSSATGSRVSRPANGMPRAWLQAASGTTGPAPQGTAAHADRKAATPAARLIIRLTATCTSALASSLSASAQRHCPAQSRSAPSSPPDPVHRLRGVERVWREWASWRHEGVRTAGNPALYSLQPLSRRWRACGGRSSGGRGSARPGLGSSVLGACTTMAGQKGESRS